MVTYPGPAWRAGVLAHKANYDLVIYLDQHSIFSNDQLDVVEKPTNTTQSPAAPKQVTFHFSLLEATTIQLLVAG